MPATWEEIARPCSWMGVEFAALSISAEHGREIDKREYPGRDGRDLEDRGRQGLTVQLRAVFFGEDYPDALDRLLAKIDGGGIGELVHPIHGRMRAACERAVEVHDPEDALDAASLDLTFVEHTEDALGPFVSTESEPALANAIRAASDTTATTARKLQAYLDSLSAPSTPALAAAPALAATAAIASSAAVDRLEVGAADMSAPEIQAAVNGALVRIDEAARAVANYAAPAEYELGVALTALAASLARYGAALIQARPPLVEVEVLADVPLLVWAHARYGSSARAAEVIALNPIADPLRIPRGTRLRVYAS